MRSLIDCLTVIKMDAKNIEIYGVRIVWPEEALEQNATALEKQEEVTRARGILRTRKADRIDQ